MVGRRRNKCLIFKFLSDIIHGDAPYFISKGVTYMKKPLTDKERAILEFVISATRLNGYPPSVRDICAETGIKSTSTVFSYIKRLEEKGYLEKEDGKSRSIRTKADPAERNSIRVPLIGDVAAGVPHFGIRGSQRRRVYRFYSFGWQCFIFRRAVICPSYSRNKYDRSRNTRRRYRSG